ncbi:hypothetical protein ABZ749_31765, partial [Micromonospora sp. NPDC047753]
TIMVRIVAVGVAAGEVAQMISSTAMIGTTIGTPLSELIRTLRLRSTPGGVRVRNVAHPVIKQAYSVFHVGDQLDTDQVSPIGQSGSQRSWS